MTATRDIATNLLPRRRGPPPFQPTDDQRRMVERAVGLGFTQERIAALLGITKPTLEKHFREELDRGGAVVEYQVGSSLVDQALKGNVNAQALYLSRRAGWKETQVVETKHARLDNMTEAELMQELADRANALGVKIDVNINCFSRSSGTRVGSMQISELSDRTLTRLVMR